MNYYFITKSQNFYKLVRGLTLQEIKDKFVGAEYVIYPVFLEINQEKGELVFKIKGCVNEKNN